MKSYEKFISRDEVALVHETSLRILKDIGIKFEHPRALEIFKRHGAKTDGEIVYITEKMVRDAIKTVPSSYVLSSSRAEDIIMGNGECILTCAGGRKMYDNGNIRDINNTDVVNSFKMCDTSEQTRFGIMFPFADKSRFSPEAAAMAEMAMVIKYSKKHLGFSVRYAPGLDEDGTVKAYKKGIELVRQAEGLSDKRMVITNTSPITPLRFDRMALANIMATIEENQPIQIICMALPMLTAPSRVAGMLALTNAEIVAGMVFSQMMKPGTPFNYGGTSSGIDMRNVSQAIGAPETALMIYGVAAMADFYHVPFRTGGGLTDALEPDTQAALESMMLFNATIDVEPDFVQNAIGTMGGFNITCFEKMVLDEEIVRYVKRLHKGIDCNPDTMCFDEIKAAGHGGSFLRGRTPKYLKEEFIMPKFFNRKDTESWKNEGAVTQLQMMRDIVKERINSFDPYQLDKDMQKRLNQYIPEEYRENI